MDGVLCVCVSPTEREKGRKEERKRGREGGRKGERGRQGEKGGRSSSSKGMEFLEKKSLGEYASTYIWNLIYGINESFQRKETHGL